MAQNATRSMNAELRQGAVDGKYKNEAPNRGGVVETANKSKLVELDSDLYGTHGGYDGRDGTLPALDFVKMRAGQPGTGLEP